MTDQDRLAEIKTEWFGPDGQRSPRIRHGLAAHHVDWLIGEVERLRVELEAALRDGKGRP